MFLWNIHLKKDNRSANMFDGGIIFTMTIRKFWKRVIELLHDNRTVLREEDNGKKFSAYSVRKKLKGKKRNKRFLPLGFCARNILTQVGSNAF